MHGIGESITRRLELEAESKHQTFNEVAPMTRRMRAEILRRQIASDAMAATSGAPAAPTDRPRGRIVLCKVWPGCDRLWMARWHSSNQASQATEQALVVSLRN
jgi:hypothetical protein